MLPETAPQDAFERLRRLPFVELSDDGLVIHDTVREAIAALLVVRSRSLQAVPGSGLATAPQEVTRASNQEMWRYTADLLYILQNPIVREAFFPTTEHLYAVEAARPEDGGRSRDRRRLHAAGLGRGHRRPGGDCARDVPGRRGTGSMRSPASDGAREMDRVSHRLVEEDPIARAGLGPPSPVIRCRAVSASCSAEHGFARLRRGAVTGPGGDLARHQAAVHGACGPACDASIRSSGMSSRTGRWSYRWASRCSRAPGRVRWGPLSRDSERLRASVGRWLAAPGWWGLNCRSRTARSSTRVQHQLVLDGRRVDLTQARVRRLDLPRPAQGQGRRAVGSAAGRMGLRRHRRQQRDRGERTLAPAEAGRPLSAIETVRGLGYRFAPPG